MSRASPGVSPSAEFVNADGEVCAVWPAEDGSLRCAVLGADGAPNAPLTTFPELKLEPM
jgi:hypothetical protein